MFARIFARKTTATAETIEKVRIFPTEAEVADAIAALAADRSTFLANLPTRPVSTVGIG